jgi:hypothetical protein
VTLWHERFDGRAFREALQVARNKAVGRLENTRQKVAAHETFAQFLRLYL